MKPLRRWSTGAFVLEREAKTSKRSFSDCKPMPTDLGAEGNVFSHAAWFQVAKAKQEELLPLSLGRYESARMLGDAHLVFEAREELLDLLRSAILFFDRALDAPRVAYDPAMHGAQPAGYPGTPAFVAEASRRRDELEAILRLRDRLPERARGVMSADRAARLVAQPRRLEKGDRPLVRDVVPGGRHKPDQRKSKGDSGAEQA